MCTSLNKKSASVACRFLQRKDLNEVVKPNAEYFGEALQLDVGYKSFSAFYSLYGILIYVYTDELHFVRKRPL